MLVSFLARNPSPLLSAAARAPMSTTPVASAAKETVSVEYAKSGRSTCKGCSASIAKGALRLGASARDPRGFDSTKWYHVSCFPASSHPLGPVEKVKGFDSIKDHDLEGLRGLEKNHKRDASAVSPLEEPSPKKVKTDQSSPAEGEAEKAIISVEYAKSGRSACKGCSKNIAKGTLRLGSSVRDPRGFGSTKWYHIACFPASSHPVFPVENVKGFDSIENSDREELRKLEENHKRDRNATDQLKELDRKKEMVHSIGDTKEGTENNLEEVKSSTGNKRIVLVIPFSSSDIKKTYKDATLPAHWNVFNTVIFREQDDGLHASAKIAAFDFDGCLAKTSVRSIGADKWSLQHKSIPERLQRLYNDGYKLVIFTNESNIERWKNKRQQAVDSKVGRLDNFIECVKVPIQVFISCGLGKGKGTPDDPFRKPNPGMWWLMTEHFNSGIAIDMDQSFYVGDAAGRENDHSDADIEFAKIQSLEEGAEFLRERCLKFHKGCRKYTEGLGEAYDGDIAFASSLEAFGGGHNDPISVAFGGPVMTKFTIALREIGTYKEVLRSQVEHMLNDKLVQFVDIDLHDLKDARKRFDKASLLYDQAREKYLSLKKGTRTEVAIAVEDELHSTRSSFEQARFNLVTALSNIEAKKRFEFLEAVSGTMDAHLRYFKQGYELLHQMEPYINQVLAYAQQSRERSNYEQAALVEKMQEFKRQIDRESRWSPNGMNDSPNGDGIQAIGRSSHKMIEAVMQSASKGKVQTIRQGYLSKRSSNLRGDWKRRFFVLDSRGMLYYYRKQNSRPSSGYSSQRSSTPSEHGSGLLSRWFSSHYHGGVHDEKSVARHTVNLLTSTIKADADQSDLRFCFRIISPTKNYTLQAESAMDQMDWIEKITGVIASLLSSQSPERRLLLSPKGSGHHRTASESSSFSSSTELDHSIGEDCMLEKNSGSGYFEHSARVTQHHRTSMKPDKPIDLLRKVVGNNICADCGAAEPDWASLNLGVLLCIECSGVHRNLGVHISKVRSLTLDVRVWEPSVINLFQSLGNTFANTIWEEMLPLSSSVDHGDISRADGLENTSHNLVVSKPKHSDPISVKEKFIHAKYAEKDFVRKHNMDEIQLAQQMWDNVSSNNKKGVYSLIVGSNADVNLTYGQTSFNSALTLGKALLLQEQPASPSDGSSRCVDHSSLEKNSPRDSLSPASTSARIDELDDCVEGLSLLHLACRVADMGMVELLLQYGANVNSTDSRGRTPLHHSILKGRHIYAKLLLSRGADSQATDRDGRTALQYAIDSGTIDDEEILVLLEDPSR